MKNNYRIFILLFVLSFIQQAQGTHIMGSDLTYRNIGTGIFEIRLVVYRDCEGINVPNDTLYAVANKTINMGVPKLVSRKNVTGQRPHCTPVPCNTSGYGVEEWVFLDTLDLSSETACDWLIHWDQCCRNSTITTGGANAHFYNELTLNKCLNNSSPIYTQNPVVYLLEGEDVILNIGILDTVDGFDSLSFSMVNPQISLTNPVPFNTSYSATSPLKYLGFPNPNTAYPGGFRLSPTGDLLFRPVLANEVAIMAIEVKEWMKINGVLTVVGKTRRDIQVIVQPNPTNEKSPYFSAFPTPYTTICEGDSLILDLNTADSNATDSTFIGWNSGLGGATFTTNNGSVQNGSGQLVWVAPVGSARPGPYVVTFTVTDNDCPLSRKAARSFFVFVNDSSNVPVVDAGPDVYEYSNPVSFNVSGNVPSYPYANVRWRTSGDGYFTDSLARETSYFPGTQDRMKCTYELYFELANYSTCIYPQGKYVDTMKVIKVYSNPDAGADQQVYFGDTVFLTGLWAVHRGQKAAWVSSGDGHFGDSLAQKTYYVPGNSDWTDCNWGIRLETYGTACPFQTDSLILARKEGTIYQHQDIYALHGDSALINMLSDSNFDQQISYLTLGDGTFSDSLGTSSYYIPGVQDLAACSAVIVVGEYPANACFVNRDTFLYQKTIPIFEAGSNLQMYYGDTAQLSALPLASPNYQFGYWSTAGDGHFIDSNDAQTTYIPGTSDWANCGTTLYWNEIDQNCGGRIDSLKILRVSTTVSAGSDQSLYYHPSISYSLLGWTDTANGQSGYWTTSGDGTFNDTFDLNAVYTPGTNDLQNCEVTLTLTAYPSGTCTVYDEIRIQIQDSAVKILNAVVDSMTFDTVYVGIYSVANRANLSWTSNGSGSFINASNVGVAYVLSASDTTMTNLELIVKNQAPCLTSWDTVVVNPTLKKVQPPNGLEEFNWNYSLYPNPANHKIHLESPDLNRIREIRIFDIHGKEIELIPQLTENAYIWDVSGMSEGVYILMIKEDHGLNHVLRFILR